MIELLVAALCLGQYKCDMASKAYLSQNPAPKVWAKEQTYHMERIVGKQAVVGASVLVAIAADKPYQIKLNRYFSFGKQGDDMLLLYGTTF